MTPLATAPVLKPWQEDAVPWLMSNDTRGIRYFADDMGVGKTAPVIEAARRLGLHRVLIVCPKIARHMWVGEWRRFWPRSARSKTGAYPEPVHEMKKIRDEIPEDGHVVCTFNFARERHVDLFINGMWDCMVIDEFHDIRGTDAARTRAILHPETGLVKRSRRMWALTGTPIANHLGELYPILKLAGVYTGSLDGFVRRYCMTYYDQDRGELKIVGANDRNLPELHKLLDESGIMLRRLKQDAMPDLPGLSYEHVVVRKGEVDLEKLFPEWSMSDRMRELVETVNFQRSQAWNVLRPEREGELERLSFSEAVDQIAALSQSISELLLLTGMQKVAAVVKLIRSELAAGLYPKIFLITRHTVVSEAILHGLRDFGAVRLYGGTLANARTRAVKRFTEDDACRVFIGQVKACGPSVNLTANAGDGRGGRCWEVGVVEQSPVPGENNQAFARNHRIGCTHEVRVRLFKLDDPVDKRWEELVFNKSVHIAKTMREDLFLSREFDPIG